MDEQHGKSMSQRPAPYQGRNSLKTREGLACWRRGTAVAAIREAIKKADETGVLVQA